MLQAALEYAGYGWRVVPVYGVRTNGSCTCYKGDECKSPGKHPIGAAWQETATCDEEKIVELFAEWSGNLGLLLGPKSGVVDIEFDDEEGKRVADELLGECYTPTYKSGRSVHRLFKWNTLLPALTVPKINGLECRLGQDSKGAQSVVPPSRHYSGAKYSWLPGLSPSEVGLADVPLWLVVRLANTDGGSLFEKIAAEKRPKEHWEQIGEGKPEGSRNQDMASVVGKLLRSMAVLDDGSIQVALASARGINDRQRPPLDDKELRSVFTSILKTEKARRATEEASGVLASPPEQQVNGTKASTHGMRLVIVRSDPPDYKLYAPQWSDREEGFVRLTAQDLCNPAAIRRQVLEQVHYPLPVTFAKAWNAKEGLFEQLVFSAEREEAPIEERRRGSIAEFLLDKIEKAISDGNRHNNDGVPIYETRERPSTGSPTMLKDGSVVFLFRTVWEEMARSEDKVKRPELSKVLQKVGARFEPFGGKNYKSLSPESIRLLKEFVSQERGLARTNELISEGSL